MITLTTRERDILRIILKANRPIGSVELAEMLHLTSRQVNYSMKSVRAWLKYHNQPLKTAPGLGFATLIAPEQAQALSQKIDTQSEIQIVLSVGQRQQLLALFLLTRFEPVILSQLEQLTQVSRVTLIKDLNEIEAWLGTQTVELIRKPNFGIQIHGLKSARQQALAVLLWGEATLSDEALVEIAHHKGLTFKLQGDTQLSPLVEQVGATLTKINVRRAINVVARAEEQLGGRFSDDAVLHLALGLAIQGYWIQERQHLEVDTAELQWLQNSHVWPSATEVAQRLGRDSRVEWKLADIANIAREILAAPRIEILPDELKHFTELPALLEQLMTHISQAFAIPTLKLDATLQNGLLSNIIPAYFRQRFQLWFPAALNNATLPEACEQERVIAQQIAEILQSQWHLKLPANEVNNVIILLRAAFMRNQIYRSKQVIVVCPSGMATAQLLIARVKARFPHLHSMEVVSLRDLTPARAAMADLILTTISLPKPFAGNPKTVQVHPLLTPNDIEAITQFLT